MGMGVCSSYTISRREAQTHLIAAVMDADNETLARLMDECFGGERPRMKSPGLPPLANYHVVPEYSEGDYRPVGGPYQDREERL